MKSRYPNLTLLYGDNKYGYYINYSLKGMKEILIKEYNNLVKKPTNTPYYLKILLQLHLLKVVSLKL
jgi:hypothetical protein